MADLTELVSELHDINTNLEKLNDTMQASTLTIYRGIISAAKIQSAQSLYDRNSAIKEADDYINQIGGEND